MTTIPKALSLIIAALVVTALLTGCESGDHSGHDHPQHQH
jgi:hypothetical protein